MKCEYCSVEVSDIELEQHNESVTHQHNEYKLLEKAVEMNVETREDLFDYRRLKKLFDENKIFSCGKTYFDGCNCNDGSLIEILAQEKCCYNEFRNKKNINEDFFIEADKHSNHEPYKYIECDMCSKKFYDKGQKLKPIYALNTHKKICKQAQTRKQITYILEHFKTFRHVRSTEERIYVENIYNLCREYDS